MSKCPQVEIQELEERLEVAAYVATDRQVYIAELEAENAQLRAELVEKENAIYQYNVWSSADTVKIAQLQAVVDAVQLKLSQYMETNDPVAVSYAAQLSRVIEEVE
jgi:hypothetical protein